MLTRLFALPALLLVLACNTAAPAAGPGSPGQPAARSGPTTLRSILKVEPASLAAKPLESTGISIAHATRLFNATLDQSDSQEATRPYLAEALPALNTDSWSVTPDGKMQTTWRLKPNLTWHDGTPFSADDFVFGWQVYRTPDLGVSTGNPISLMTEVRAPDPRTVVIQWSALYPDAASLANTYQALPRHILEAPLASADYAAFMNHQYWKTQYVGLGPFKLSNWEPGAFIEATAFDGHVAGRPKIDKVVVRFIPDENTALTNLVSGEIDFATDRSIRFEQAQILKREWGATGGTPVLTPAQPRLMYFQTRPELAKSPVTMDVRGRRALAHAMDRDALNLGLFNGDAETTEVFLTKTFPAYAEMDKAIAHYPTDPRRTDALLGELGYAKAGDGLFARAGDKLQIDFRQEAGDQTQREMAIITDSWRKAGVDSTVSVISSTQLRDADVRHAFSGVYSGGTSAAAKGGIGGVTAYRTPREGQRLNNGNYSGWSNPDYDKLYDAFVTTLDPNQRNQQVIQMVKMLAEDLPITTILFNYNVSAFSSTVKGADPRAFDTLINWNIHEWEIAS